MRISADFTTFNNNSNSYYNNKVNLSVNFLGRRKIVVNRANVAKVKPEAQNAIISIADNIDKLRYFFTNFKENISTCPNTLTDFKKKYKKFVSRAGSAYQFKLKDWLMSVNKLDEQSNMIKIYTRKEDESDPHLFYIEQDGAVRGNAYHTRPSRFPKGNIFMNEEQIFDSNVEYQILIADREISNFLRCMENGLKNLDKNKQVGVLNDELQAKMWDIEQNLLKIKENTSISFAKGLPQSSFMYKKSKYKNHSSTIKTRGEAFVFEDEIVSVSKLKDKNIIRIVVWDLDKKPKKLFNIEDGKQIISNDNIDFISQLPIKLKYKNQNEIDKSGIDKYLKFLSVELKNYREYVEKDILKIEPTKIEEFKPVKDNIKPEKTKAKRGPKSKQKDVNRLPAKTEEIAHTVPKKGDLLPEFDGTRRREFPSVLKLSEIDELFEEITGQTINEACGTKGNAPIPQPESFKKNVVIKHKEEPKKVETQSKEIVKTEVIKKEVSKSTKNIVLVEPSIWGLAKYLDEKEGFSIKVADGGNIDIALKEIEGVEYISLVKTSLDKKKKYFNIDCDSEKLLKTDLTRKPMIKDDNVIPYSDSDLKALGLKDDLENILGELFTALNGGEKTKALPPKMKMLQSEEKEIEKSLYVSLDEVKDKAKLDAQEYAEVYFNTFVEEFKNIIIKKLEEFEKNKSEFLKKFIK